MLYQFLDCELNGDGNTRKQILSLEAGFDTMFFQLKGHPVWRKLDSDGRVDTMQMLHTFHGSSHCHSSMASRGGMSVVGNPGYSSNNNGVGGSIPGILATSGAIGNRSSVPGLGMSPMLGNAWPRMSNSVGNIVGGGNIGRSISFGAGLSVPGLASRLNLTANTGSGNLNVQGSNRLMGGVLQQGEDEVLKFWMRHAMLSSHCYGKRSFKVEGILWGELIF